MRILFFGNADFGLPTLNYLSNSSHTLLSVVTNKDKKSGRGKKYFPTPIKEYAQKNNLHILEIENLDNPMFESKIRALNPDLMIVIAYRLLPERIFNIPKYGTINLHASLLPKYRGAAPIQHALLNGEDKTGISTFLKNDEKIDTGNLILQETIKIGEMDDFGKIYTKLSEKGPNLIMKSISHIINKEPLVKQKGKITYANKIKKNDNQINWNLGANQILNLIRAFSPTPGAFSYILDKRVKLLLSKKVSKSLINIFKYLHSFK